jgi:hypothetical protein
MAAELILIVEDHEKNRKLVRDVLQAQGYRTAEAETAEDGLRLARAELPRVIVLDVELPDGDGFALAGRRGSEAHDEIAPGLGRLSNHAGGLEGGVTNGEDVVVRLAMKPLPTLMRPLRSVDLESGEPGDALVERSDTAAVEALAVVAEAVVAWELARAAREKFGGDSLDDMLAAYRAYRERIPWRPR